MKCMGGMTTGAWEHGQIQDFVVVVAIGKPTHGPTIHFIINVTVGFQFRQSFPTSGPSAIVTIGAQGMIALMTYRHSLNPTTPLQYYIVRESGDDKLTGRIHNETKRIEDQSRGKYCVPLIKPATRLQPTLSQKLPKSRRLWSLVDCIENRSDRVSEQATGPTSESYWTSPILLLCVIFLTRGAGHPITPSDPRCRCEIVLFTLHPIYFNH
ncbi:hypothetical protein CBL_13400 [Carabus blaptoides fortunei]